MNEPLTKEQISGWVREQAIDAGDNLLLAVCDTALLLHAELERLKVGRKDEGEKILGPGQQSHTEAGWP